VNEEGDVELFLAVASPFGLFEEVAAEVSVAPLAGGLFVTRVAVALGVGEDDDGEGLGCLEIRKLGCEEISR
jgi:hypothetical protein